MTDVELQYSTEEAEDFFFDACERTVDLLLEEIGAEPFPSGRSIDTALDDLAGALVEAMADGELGAPPGIAPHFALRHHPEFPLGLARRALAAMNLRGNLDGSRWGCLLAGYSARTLLLDGKAALALEMSVLALHIGSTSGSTATRLAVGVLAAALGRLGHQDLAAIRHLELWAGGVEIESWRQPLEWIAVGPWTDGVWFDGALTYRPRHRNWPVDEPMGRREEQWFEGSSHATYFDADRISRLQRFGVDRNARRHRLSLADQERMQRDLEDEAIQQEWLFL